MSSAYTIDNTEYSIYFDKGILIIKAINLIEIKSYKCLINSSDIEDNNLINSLELLYDMLTDWFKNEIDDQIKIEINEGIESIKIKIVVDQKYFNDTLEINLLKEESLLDNVYENKIKSLNQRLISMEEQMENMIKRIKFLEKTNMTMTFDHDYWNRKDMNRLFRIPIQYHKITKIETIYCSGHGHLNRKTLFYGKKQEDIYEINDSFDSDPNSILNLVKYIPNLNCFYLKYPILPEKLKNLLKCKKLEEVKIDISERIKPWHQQQDLLQNIFEVLKKSNSIKLLTLRTYVGYGQFGNDIAPGGYPECKFSIIWNDVKYQ